jgi:hypothetical protein
LGAQGAQSAPSHLTSIVGQAQRLFRISALQAESALIAEVTDAPAPTADPASASQMQAYMKSATPFPGVPVPAVRIVVTVPARLQALTPGGLIRRNPRKTIS